MKRRMGMVASENEGSKLVWVSTRLVRWPAWLDDVELVGFVEDPIQFLVKRPEALVVPQRWS
jgi:hypothetical protein